MSNAITHDPHTLDERVRVPWKTPAGHYLTLACRIAGGTYDYGSIVTSRTALWSLVRFQFFESVSYPQSR